MWVRTRARVKRLSDVVHRPQGKAFLLVAHVGQASDQDYRHVPHHRARLQRLEHLESVQLRHDHVQQDQGGLYLLRPVDPRHAVHADLHLILRLQDSLETVCLHQAVVNNQYLFQQNSPRRHPILLSCHFQLYHHYINNMILFNGGGLFFPSPTQ